MPNLEIITIGTELLLGEIADTNSTYIARTLRDYGIDIYRITTIGDNPGRISSTIKEALRRANIIITTGGLGPTVDDPTRQAIADATGRKLIYVKELWDDIVERFKHYGRMPTENNRRQAYIPRGAVPIHNPVGTAPCFIVEIDSSYVIALPGVPHEMANVLHQSIIPYLKQVFLLESQIIKATVLHAASIGESVVDSLIGDLERYTNPTVGLLAHPGQVDIRVTVKANSTVEAEKLSKPVIDIIKERLGKNIYGTNEDTLESVICDFLKKNNLKVTIIEHGLNDTVTQRFELRQPSEIALIKLDQPSPNMEHFIEQINQFHHDNNCDIAFGVALVENEPMTLHCVYLDQTHTRQKQSKYGGPRENALLWAQNTGLDFLRRQLTHQDG